MLMLFGRQPPLFKFSYTLPMETNRNTQIPSIRSGVIALKEEIPCTDVVVYDNYNFEFFAPASDVFVPSKTFDVIEEKRLRRNKRARDYQDNDRMRNKVRSAKITKGSVYFCPDAELKNYVHVPLGVVKSWFFKEDLRFDEEKYENYRRICRSLFLCGCFDRIADLGRHFGFVDLRKVGDAPRRKEIVDNNFKIIYNEGITFHHTGWKAQANLGGEPSFSQEFVFTAEQFVNFLPHFQEGQWLRRFFRRYCAYLLWNNMYDSLVYIGENVGYIDLRHEDSEGAFVSFDVDGILVHCEEGVDLTDYHFVAQMMSFTSVGNVAKEIEDRKLVGKAASLIESVSETSQHLSGSLCKANVVLNSVAESSQSIKSSFDEIKGAAQGLTRVADTFNDILEKVQGPIEFVTSWFNNTFSSESSLYGSVLDALIDVAIILNRIFKSGVQAAGELILMTFGKYCGYSNGIRFVYQIFEGFVGSWKAQAFDLPSIPFVCSALSLFTTILGVAIYKKEFDLSRIPTIISDVSVWYNRVFVQGKNGLASLTQIFETFFDDALIMLKIPPVSQVGKLRNRCNAFIEWVNQFANFFALNDVYACMDKLIEVQEHLQEGLELRRLLSLTKGYDSEKQYLNERFSWLQTWFNTFCKSTPALIKSRPRPVCIMLQGAGGQGKTTLADAMAVDIIENCLGISRHRSDFDMLLSQLVYHYRVDPNDVDPYMNGVTENHLIMIWSEGFQESDAPTRASRSIATLMSTVDTAGLQTLQAFEGKGKISYVIPFIIITTNLKTPVAIHSTNWKSQHAVNRRFDFVYEVTAQSHCTVNATKGVPEKFLDVEMFMKDKDPLIIRERKYGFPVDASGNELGVTDTPGDVISYREMMERALDRDAHYRSTYENLKRTTPEISKTLNFGNKYLRKGVKVSEVTGGSVVMTAHMVADDEYVDAVEVDEIRPETVIPLEKVYETVDKKSKKGIEYIVVDHSPMFKDFRQNGLNGSVVNLHPTSINAIFNAFQSFGDGLVDVKRVEIVGMNKHITHISFEWKIYRAQVICNFNKGGVVFTINYPQFKTWVGRDCNVERDDFNAATFKILGNDYSKHKEAKNLLFLLECLTRQSRFYELDIIESMSGNQLTAEDHEVYGDMKRQRVWINRLKIVGYGLAGLLGLFGLVYTSKACVDYIYDKKPKEFCPDPAGVSEFIEQSIKTGNTPQISKVGTIKPVPFKPQSAKDGVPLVSRLAQVKSIIMPKPVPMKPQMVPSIDSEGQLFETDGSYAEYLGQVNVTNDEDSNSLRALIWHNTVCIYLLDDKGDPVRRIGNALFVHTRTAIMPKHYLQVLGKDGINFCFYPLQSKKLFVGSMKQCEIRYVDQDCELKDMDLISVTFPCHMAFYSLMKHIVREEDYTKFKNIPTVITTVAPWIVKDEVSLFVKEFHASVATAIDAYSPQPYSAQDKQWFVRRGFRYDVRTVEGDCGSAVVAICKHLPRKILGMHVCGNSERVKGACVALTQELVNSLLPPNLVAQGLVEIPEEVKQKIVERAFSKIGTELRATVVPVVTLGHLDEDVEVKDFYSTFRSFLDADGNYNFGSISGLVGKGLVMGKSIYNGRSSDKVLITPSCLQGRTSFPSVKVPAHITNFVDDTGTLRHVKEEGAQKLLNDYVHIDQKLLDESMEHTLNALRAIPNFQDYLKPLTVEQAVFGDESLGIRSLNVNSSPGKVLEKIKKGGLRGKRTWIDLDKKWICPNLMKLINQQMFEWENLYRRKDVFSGESKSELRKPPKHLIPRMYNSGDLVTLINSKRLFGGLVALLQKHWIDTGVTVGINCHADFDVLLEKLQSKGFKVFDGDFKNFDGKLGVPITESVMFWWIYFLFKYGFFSISEILAMFTYSHVVRFYVCIILGFFLLMQGGNPSGQYLTTQLNSVAVKVGLRIIWKILMGNYPDLYPFSAYDQHVTEFVNGDDNVVNVSDVVCEIYNQLTVAEGFAKLGMEYTDAAKCGNFRKYVGIDDIQYLKRSIVRYCHKCDRKDAKEVCCGVPSVVLKAGKVEKESILESVLWYKQGVSSYENFHSTISSALQEMYHHGRQPYNEFRDEIVDLLAGTVFAGMHLKTYAEVEHEYLLTGGTSFGFAY